MASFWRKGGQTTHLDGHSNRNLEVGFDEVERRMRRLSKNLSLLSLSAEEKEDIDEDDNPPPSTDSLHLAHLELTLSWQSFELANLRSLIEVKSNERAQAIARASTAEEELEKIKAENAVLRLRLEEAQTNGAGLVGSVKRFWSRKGGAPTAMSKDENCTHSASVGSTDGNGKSLPATKTAENLKPIVEESREDSQSGKSQNQSEKEEKEENEPVENQPNWLSEIFQRRKERNTAEEDGKVAPAAAVEKCSQDDQDKEDDENSSVHTDITSPCLSTIEERALTEFNSTEKFEEVDYRDGNPFAQPKAERPGWMKSALGLFHKKDCADNCEAPAIETTAS